MGKGGTTDKSKELKMGGWGGEGMKGRSVGSSEGNKEMREAGRREGREE